MATQLADTQKMEAICSACRRMLVLPVSQLNQKVICQHCGYPSFLTSDKVITRKEVFVPQATKIQPQATKKEARYTFYFVRHGGDTPQLGALLDLTTTQVRFFTNATIVVGTKISFMLKNRKFIVNIKDIKTPDVSVNPENRMKFEVVASHEVVLTGEVKDKKSNPHFLRK